MTEVSSCSRSYSWKGGSNTIWKNFPNRSIAIVDDIASAKKGYLSASFVYLWLYKIIRTITNLHTPDLLFQLWQPCAQDNLGDLHKLFRSHKINQMNSFWSLCITSINLMTPRAFCQKRIFWTFWRFSAWMWAKLAPIYSKKYLQNDSIPFSPLAWRFCDIFARACAEIKISRFGRESDVQL